MDENRLRYREAQDTDLPQIWQIISDAIDRRGAEGSQQWQNGYPNLQTIEDDIKAGFGYVWENDQEIGAYAAVIFDIEPAYEEIAEEWKNSGEYAVIHRVAVSQTHLGKGISTFIFQDIEEIARSRGVASIRVDTNFDNEPMLHIFRKCGYQYRGKVYFRGSERLAYEKEVLISR